MPRNSSGTYTLPAGNPVSAGSLIEASWANTTLSDLASSMTDSLSRSGEGGMTAPLRVSDGSSSTPGLAFTNATSSGFYRAGAGDIRMAVNGVDILKFQATGMTALLALVGNLTGNADTVTNGVYTAGNQSISGTKTFSDARFTDAAYSAYVNSTNAILLLDTAGGESDYFQYDRSANSFSWLVNSSVKLTLDSSGNLTATGNVTAYSDERLKKDWNQFGVDFVSRLAQVKSGSYTRTDTDERQVGVSAQALQELMPEAVQTDKEGFLSVAYGQAALAACVELAKEVVALRAEVAALKGA